MHRLIMLLPLLAILTGSTGTAGGSRFEDLPNLPQPFEMRDWREVARDYDRLAFERAAQGQFLPLIWTDSSHVTSDREGFGLYTVLGDPRMGPGHPGCHECINGMAAVISASLAGIDKRRQDGFDYVRMCENYFSPVERGGPGIFLDSPAVGPGTLLQGSMWYFLMPNMLACWLDHCYPGHGRLDALTRASADRLLEVVSAIEGDQWYTGYDFGRHCGFTNGTWREGDATAGLASIEYMAWARFGDPRYLDAARRSMDSLQRCRHNPYYEVLLPFGATLAARMNAEQGTRYDVRRFLDWFANANSACRGLSVQDSDRIRASHPPAAQDLTPRWGMLTGRWGAYDIGGLVGSPTDGGGYGFAMNTFDAVAALAPLPRYDARYARTIAKYILNAANSCRLFYANGLPATNQTCYGQRSVTRDVISYEGIRASGLRAEDREKSPCACGDPRGGRWGKEEWPSDFSLYGASHAGLLAAVVGRTSDARILEIDCLATDFHHARAYPTHAYFNPYAAPKPVTLETGKDAVDLYDLVSARFLASNITGRATVTLLADEAVVLVRTPAGGQRRVEAGRLLIDGVVVDFDFDKRGDGR
jgi:hypothetical protein